MYKGTCLVNKYGPSGAKRKHEREGFYNVDVPYLLPATQTDVILAGHFNCVLSHSDATGQRKYSRVLDILVTGLGLYDVGGTTSTRPTLLTTHQREHLVLTTFTLALHYSGRNNRLKP
jgi:hypothetical protein